jgi:Ca2+-binding RTX toxin-like protein
MRRTLFVIFAALLLLTLSAAVGSARDFTGTSGADTIVGTKGNDNINGLGSNDDLTGGKGSDVIIGSGGDDTLVGGSAGCAPADDTDHLYGRTGDDTIFGNCRSTEPDFGPVGEAEDIIFAGAGNDTIYAQDGAEDDIDCGPGVDTAYVDNQDEPGELDDCENVFVLI